MIYKYASNGTSLGVFADQNLNDGEFLAFDSIGRLYVSNFSTNSISRYASDGTPLGFYISSGLQNPRGIVINEFNDLYVNNWTTGIRKFDTNGTLTQVINDGLNDPIGLSLSGSGIIYAANIGNSRITRYLQDGSFLNHISTPSTPWMIAFTPVPEPSTYILCTLCALCFIAINHYQRKSLAQGKRSGRPGDRSAKAPTDPDVPVEGIRLLIS